MHIKKAWNCWFSSVLLRSSTTFTLQLQRTSPRRNVKAVAWVWSVIWKCRSSKSTRFKLSAFFYSMMCILKLYAMFHWQLNSLIFLFQFECKNTNCFWIHQIKNGLWVKLQAAMFFQGRQAVGFERFKSFFAKSTWGIGLWVNLQAEAVWCDWHFLFQSTKLWRNIRACNLTHWEKVAFFSLQNAPYA